MELVPQLLPILTRNDWQESSTVASTSFLECDHPAALQVSYALVSPMGNFFTLRSQVESGEFDLDQLDMEAMSNLRSSDNIPPWENFGTPHGPTLVRMGDNITSSDLLVPEIIKQARNFFDCQLLFVAMPTRDKMIATDNADLLALIAAEAYAAAVIDHENPLSPIVYICSEGVPIGIAEREEPLRTDKDAETIVSELAYGPIATLLMVAGNDKEVDQKDLDTFITYANKRLEKLENPILREVLDKCLEEGIDLFNYSVELTPTVVLETIALTAATYLENVDRELYIALLKDVGNAVAEASAGLFGARKAQAHAIRIMEKIMRTPQAPTE